MEVSVEVDRSTLPSASVEASIYFHVLPPNSMGTSVEALLPWKFPASIEVEVELPEKKTAKRSAWAAVAAAAARPALGAV